MSDHPLAGKKVVVTRPRARSGPLVGLLRAAGAEVIELPMIEIADPRSWEPVDIAVAGLADDRFEWIAVTSTNAVEKFFSRVPDVAVIRCKVAAVGRKTAAALERRGVTIDLIPDGSSAAELARALGSGSGAVLVPRVENAPREMIDILRNNGWEVAEVVAYRNVRSLADSPEAERVRSGDFDVVTFASGSAVRSFAGRVARAETLGLSKADEPDRIVACIGPVTAKEARRLGFRVDVVPKEPTDEGLVNELTGP